MPRAAPSSATTAGIAPTWSMPGPLVLRLMGVALGLLMLAAGVGGWLVVRAVQQDALQQLARQQSDEVDLLARLFAGKIELLQKQLRAAASRIAPQLLAQPAVLQRALQQEFAAMPWLASMTMVRPDGTVLVHLQAAQASTARASGPVLHEPELHQASAAERAILQRTVREARAQMGEVPGDGPAAAHIAFSLPLLGANGQVLGALGVSVPLQTSALFAPAVAAAPAQGPQRLLVFTRAGRILFHTDAARVLGSVRDEPGFAPGTMCAPPVLGMQEHARVQGVYLASCADMPLPQWTVARVSAVPDLLGAGAVLRRGAGQAALALLGVCALLLLGLMAWLAQPLTRLGRAAQRALRHHDGASAGALAAAEACALPTLLQPWPAHRPAHRSDVQALQREAAGDESTGADEVDVLLVWLQRLQQEGQRQWQRSGALAAQLQAILEHAPVGIALSRQGVLQLLGRQACQLLGYGVQELQGCSARRLHASDADYAHWRARVQTEFAAHGVLDGEARFLRKDGSLMWARVQARPIQAGDAEAGILWLFEDITALREVRHQQEWERTHDALTQLCNRASFEQRLGLLLAERGQAAQVAARSGNVAVVHAGFDPAEAGVLLFLDLDHLTLVNEVAGHGAGDDVLRHFARLIDSQVRHSGWAARLGGDKFGVVLPRCSLARGQAVAEQLRAAVQGLEAAYHGHGFTLSVSIGLVPLAEAHWHDLRTVLRTADMACYEAKRAGRNCVRTQPVLQDRGDAALTRGLRARQA
ncbi:sensor domain-containing diguanylate cyclase [Extensimonas vulgaris]|uniref:PAS domain S-box-containing protein/diguanylate cyclase (GGDEF)-like protein n=1 Tax=Extensimonas vulgaris TaxID=1031594 RepID=A0A369AI74_9BURK|nr:diguanylate cyclase [Extensimonas vulgaris]RCX07857.1 PAS domain S-box-containing protein/diguanylate cyclase (GGDEF)-like protein [Extensimonas vulgaris]TWI35571.1 PAS domain S-box-containing protein/diguanylate cyclase (GGDEF)-like protein [Extensimonas vulgaris]TXD13271.1 diguanylate cyclase [Extensimonas vulgaris]